MYKKSCRCFVYLSMRIHVYKKNMNGKYNFELKQKKVYVEIEWALYGRHKFAQRLNFVLH